jgi:uncharacterized protein (DUF305 family)
MAISHDRTSPFVRRLTDPGSMSRPDSNALYVVLLTALIGAGCSTAAATGTTSPEPSSPAPSATAADEEFEAIFRARRDSARMQYTDADVSFMSGMIPHHAQALVMARMVPTHGASPIIQTLAARIMNAQRDEIALMQRWLRDRNEPVPEPGEGGAMAHAGDHAMHMPGMLTPQQLSALDAARGEEFDRMFLTFMIQHHRGAVTMVHELFGTPGAGLNEDAFRIASDIQVDQATEIARMELMLSEMTGEDSSR